MVSEREGIGAQHLLIDSSACRNSNSSPKGLLDSCSSACCEHVLSTEGFCLVCMRQSDGDGARLDSRLKPEPCRDQIECC